MNSSVVDAVPGPATWQRKSPVNGPCFFSDPDLNRGHLLADGLTQRPSGPSRREVEPVLISVLTVLRGVWPSHPSSNLRLSARSCDRVCATMLAAVRK